MVQSDAQTQALVLLNNIKSENWIFCFISLATKLHATVQREASL